MVWAAFASDTGKSSLVFILEGMKVTSQVDLNISLEKALSWLTEIFEDSYIFTQDCALAHTVKLTHKKV